MKPTRCDLHLHSAASRTEDEWYGRYFGCPESYADPLAQYDLCKARGMTLVTLTDHDTIAGGLKLADKPDFFLSEEITTRFPESGCVMHVLAWNIDPDQHGHIQEQRNDVYALTGTNSHWKLVGKLPRPLAYGVSVTTDSGVICLGGSDADRHYSDVFRIDFRNGIFSVQPLPSLPVPMANAAGAMVGETIYIAGGSEKPGELSALNQCFALDLAGKNPAWQAVPPCPGKARILPVAAAWKNDFYLFGGAALEPTNGKIARVYLQDAWRYEPRQGWQRLADLPKPCVAGPTPAPEVDGNFLLIGGDDGSHLGFQPLEKHPGFATEMLAYDVNAGHWRTNGTVPAPRATLPAVFWQNRFVIPSGEMRPGVRSPEIWTLRLDNGHH